MQRISIALRVLISREQYRLTQQKISTTIRMQTYGRKPRDNKRPPESRHNVHGLIAMSHARKLYKKLVQKNSLTFLA